MATFDVEDESVLSVIFKDSFPDSWRDSPDFAQYLAELSSFGVDKLSREPERLAEDRGQILEQTQDLAFHNYKTFIQTAECSRDIFQDFQIIEKHVGSMLEKLPKLSTECNQFMSRAQEINVSRRMNNLTLQRHTQLLEILEMPQLMDTCVRNGYYEEALELAAHVKRLEKKHASIPVIVNIVNEVKSSTQLMLNQLIQQLRTNVQLPACLRVIGYLRRMDVFTEAELRIKFLQARDAWFKSILDGIPSDDPYYHITKTIEASRVHLFDIITQYRAIFSDEDPLVSTSRDDGPNESALFHGWVVQKVSQFLGTLESDLQEGVGGRLDSVLGQCMYFGLSFSRVGADFRGLLAPIFQRAAMMGFTRAVDEANIRFDEAMQSYTLLGTPAVLPGSAFTLATAGTGQLQPPTVLLEFPPLAAYCNHLLTAFNDLRLCAPLSLASDVASQVQASLEQAASVILSYHRSEEATFNTQEQERFGQFCLTMAEDLMPHLNKCLQTLFSPSQLAQMLGISVLDLLKVGSLGRVDIKTVLEPMNHLIPAKPEEVTTAPADQPAPVEATAPETDESEPGAETTTSEEIVPPTSHSEKTEHAHDEEHSQSEKTEHVHDEEHSQSEKTEHAHDEEHSQSEKTEHAHDEEHSQSESGSQSTEDQSEQTIQIKPVQEENTSDQMVTEDSADLDLDLDLDNIQLDNNDAVDIDPDVTLD